MLTIILPYSFKETLLYLQLLRITQFYVFAYNLTININLHTYSFSNYRIKDVIMNIISWMQYINIQAL